MTQMFGPRLTLGRGATFGWVAAFLIVVAIGAAVGMAYLGSTRIQYFPKSFLAPTWMAGVSAWDGRKRPVIDDLEEGWYTAYWRAAEEPSLYLASRHPSSPYAHSIRFTWLRSFHAPMMVRMDTLSDGRLLMTATKLAGAGGYSAEAPSARIVRLLTSGEQRALEATLSSTTILDQPPVDDSYGGLDGSRWIMEGSSPGEYRYINRWSPGEHAPTNYQKMREAGLFMLGLTGWSLEPVY
jgi:hypothetical protein